MEVTTSDGLVLVLERTRATVPNDNGEMHTVTPAAYGGPVMGPWTHNLPAVAPWDGWPVNWDAAWWNGVGLGARIGVAMSCADLNSRALATMPRYVRRGRDIIQPPAWVDNPEPRLYASGVDAFKQLVNSVQVRGEAFCFATSRYASPNGFTPGQIARWGVANPDAMSVQAEDGETVYRLRGEQVDSADVLHIRHQTWPGYLRGIGPLEWTAANVMGAAAMEQMAANMAMRGGIPWSVLKSRRNLNGDQAADLQSAWVTAGARRNGAPAVLSGDLELEILQLSPKDMALLDLRIFDEQRIASAFGVPPYLIGLPQSEGLVYSNATSLFMFHWRSCLLPMATNIAAALSRWALPAGQVMEFDPDRYIQDEFSQRAATYSTLFNIHDPTTGARAMEVDEIRARERFSPNPDASLELTSTHE